MNHRRTLEFAALLSAHGHQFIEAGAVPPDDLLGEFWSASRERFRRWSLILDEYARGAPAAGTARAWPQARATVRHVFVAGVLARVWGALLCAHDRTTAARRGEPVARNVLVAQLEAEQRALTILVRGPHVSLLEAAALDRLRRGTERWTDLLVGHLVERYDLVDFACDLDRALDFAGQFRRAWGERRELWVLLLTSLRTAFPELPSDTLPEDRGSARRIAAAILACLPPEMFGSDGRLKSLWLRRIEQSGLKPEGPPPADVAGGSPGSLLPNPPAAPGDLSSSPNPSISRLRRRPK